MKRVTLLLLPVMLVWLAGCGGGAGRQTPATGRATVRLEWPQTTRLIPVASNSVKITVARGDTKLAEQVLVRPAQGGDATANFTDLPVGSVTVTATAYPTADAKGTPQATATVTATIASGANAPVSITMASTVDRVEINPSHATVEVGATVQLVGSAQTASGANVLVAPTRLAWESLTPVIAAVDATGKVTGLQEGDAQIRFSDTESGKSTTQTVPVTPSQNQQPDPNVHVLPFVANDLIYSPFTGKVYASVPSSAPTNGNTVTAIDPATGATGPSVSVGSEPGKLALSDDGQYLYVALNGAGAIRRIDMASFTAGLEFSLGTAPWNGSRLAEDMAVLPGQPGSIAVTCRFRYTTADGGLAIYDNGVARPNTTSDLLQVSCIAFGATASRLYGFNGRYSEWGFRRFAVDTNGLALVDTTGSLASSCSRIVYAGGRVYTTAGAVIDPEARVLVGTLAAGLVCPDLSLDRVFVLTQTAGVPTTTLRAFDPNTFAQVASKDLSAYTPAGSFIRWGAKGLAFRTTDGRIVFITEAPGT